ncbi:MAG: hypothetical protein NC212_01425 [Staphylococcus sp.]|nr:hypothetical protein [Staphylococcus sp.]
MRISVNIVSDTATKCLYGAVAFVSLLFSCSKDGNSPLVRYEDKRDNVTKISSEMIVSIDDNLPMLHTCDIIMTGDTLLFDDHLNGEFKFTAYDISSNCVIGRFGKPGNGPGELANYGGIFYDENSRNLYVTEAGQGKLFGFYLPQAISDSLYIPFVKYNMDFNGGNNAYACPYYLNDSTVICTTYIRNEEARTFSTHIGRLNIQNQTVSIIDSLPNNDNIRYSITVSPKHNTVFASARTKDEMRIYDMDGHLLKVIYGPDYDEHIDNHRFYFSGSVFCGDKILAIYAGGSDKKGHDVLVMNLDGKYIKTLRFDMPIQTLVYHEKTDRLYLSTDDTPQFGYIENFSEILDGEEVAEKQPTNITTQKDSTETNVNRSSEEDPVDVSSTSTGDKGESGVEIIMSHPETAKLVNGKPTRGPLIFIDANTHGATRTDHLQVGAYPEGEAYRYTIGIMNQSSEPVSIKSICLQDDYFKGEWSMGNTLQPNMIGFLYLTCKKPLEEKDYPLIIKYRDNKYSQQVLNMTLHKSGAQLYNEMHGLK